MAHASPQNKTRTLFYAMLAITLLITAYTYFNDSRDQTVIVAASPTRKTVLVRGGLQSVAVIAGSGTQAINQRVFYQPKTDIFAVYAANKTPAPSTEPPKTVIVPDQKIQLVNVEPTVAQPTPPPQPTAPPIPFKYIGKLYGDDEYVVFLHLHGKSIMARTGDTIAQTYKIEGIQPPVMTATYLPLNIKQTIDIGAP